MIKEVFDVTLVVVVSMTMATRSKFFFVEGTA